MATINPTIKKIIPTMKPIAYLCFANDIHNASEGYLAELNKERDGVRTELKNAVKKDWLVIEHEPDASLNRITDFLSHPDNLQRIVIFHYAGHANGDGIAIRTLDDTPSNNLAAAAGLADMININQKNLQLVFLNACSTQEQVQFFLKAGVPNVIATSRDIEDAVAVDFALSFYDALSNNRTIQTAFDIAQAYIKSKSGSNKEEVQRGFVFKSIAKPTLTLNDAWKLHNVSPEAANWRVGIGRQLEGSIKMFISYAEEDNNLKDKLLKHLAVPIRRSKKIEVVNQIKIGEDTQKTKEQLYEADLILLLVSDNYLAGEWTTQSDFSTDLEQIESIAMQRRANGEAKVIPVYLSPVTLDDDVPLEFARIQGLPRLPNKPKYVSQWNSDIDTVMAHIAQNIMGLVNEMLNKAKT